MRWTSAAIVQDSGHPRTPSAQANSYGDPPQKNKINIQWGTMYPISDIKLIRTDTTLDLSQKAEKGMNFS